MTLYAVVMYKRRMLVKKRTNIYLLERQMKRLQKESERTGSSIAELIRRAIDKVYPEKEQGR